MPIKTKRKPRSYASVRILSAAAMAGLIPLSAQSVDNKFQGQIGGKTATQATQSAISGAISNFGSAGMFRVNLSAADGSADIKRGAAAGDEGSPWTLWATPIVTQVNNRIDPITSKGSVGIVMLGLEHNQDDELIRGVILAFDQASLDTPYNAGTVKGNGYTVSPYIALPLSETWMLDASAGLGKNDLKTNISGTTASPKDDRSLVSIGLTKSQSTKNRWLVNTKLGYSYSRDEVGAYTDSSGASTAASTSTLNQLKVGVHATYMADKLKPFVGVYSMFNDFSVSGGSATKPKEYSVTPQLQLGISPSAGPIYASVVAQIERDRSAIRAYFGYRY